MKDVTFNNLTGIFFRQSKDPEIHEGPNKAFPKYQIGMKVRDRRKSISQPQTYGVVDSIKGNEMKIVWNPEDKEKKIEEVFDMIQHTEILSQIISEV